MGLEEKTLVELRELAKAKGIEKYSSMRKADLIRALTPEKSQPAKAEPKKKEPTPEREQRRRPAGQAKEKRGATPQTQGRRSAGAQEPEKRGAAGQAVEKRSVTGQEPANATPQEGQENVRPKYHGNNVRSRYHDGSDGLISVMRERQVEEVPPTELKDLDSGITKNGILEIMVEGYGFIRCDNYLPGEDDVYVSPQFIRRFGLRTGDIITGNLRRRTQNEKFSAL